MTTDTIDTLDILLDEYYRDTVNSYRDPTERFARIVRDRLAAIEARIGTPAAPSDEARARKIKAYDDLACERNDDARDRSHSARKTIAEAQDTIDRLTAERDDLVRRFEQRDAALTRQIEQRGSTTLRLRRERADLTRRLIEANRTILGLTCRDSAQLTPASAPESKEPDILADAHSRHAAPLTAEERELIDAVARQAADGLYHDMVGPALDAIPCECGAAASEDVKWRGGNYRMYSCRACWLARRLA